jgi:hypothetical protein
MSLVLQSSGGGSITINEPTTASNLTITVPAVTGTMLTTASAGTVLQVVSTTTTVDVTTTGTATVTTASITPSSSSNKILTFFAGEVNNLPTSNAYGYLSLSRSGSSLTGPSSVGMQVAQNITATSSRHFLDSPATTSSVTYTLTVGKGSGGTASTTCILGATIVLMEIAA